MEVSFQLDANGILHVTAADKVTGAKANAQIRADRGRLTEEDIERMIADAEKYREEDELLAKKVHLRNGLEEAVFRIKSMLVDNNDIAGVTALDEILEWLEYESEGASLEEIQAKCDWMYKKYKITIERYDGKNYA